MSRRFGSLAAVLLAAAMALAVACEDDGDGGSRTPTSTPAPGSEDRLAQEMVLELDDFPQGWVHELPPDEADLEQGPLADCNTERFAGETGRARGGQFSESDVNVVGVHPVVYVFGDRSSAEAGLALYQADVDCAVRGVNEGRATFPSGVRYGNASVQQIRLEGRDDVTLFQLSYDRIDGDGATERLFFTTGLVVVERTLVAVDGFKVDEQFDPGLLEVYVDRQIEKVEDEL